MNRCQNGVGVKQVDRISRMLSRRYHSNDFQEQNFIANVIDNTVFFFAYATASKPFNFLPRAAMD